MKRPSCLIPALISAVFIFAAQGCVPRPEAKLFMYPDDKGSEGYSRKAEHGVFENKSIRVAVRKIGESDEGLSQEVIAHLLKKDYLIFRMEIENTSTKYRAIYNPSFTTFTDDEMGYGTPIDYTDLYDIAQDVWEQGEKDVDNRKALSMKGLKGLFYDLSTTIPPGAKTSKLLIFKPISKDCKKAALTLSELYIGTEAIRVIFPFVFKPKEG